MRPAPVFPPPRAPGRRRKKRSWLLGLITYMFAGGVLLFLGGLGVAGYYVWQASRDLPDYERLVNYEPPVMTRVHAADGTLMAEYAFERRIFVPINIIPDMLIKAFLAAEDRRFFEHGGLDFIGIARAVYTNVTRGGRAQGASTITQQVAKNLLLSSERTLDRKLKEAILAIRMERTFEKPKILELYLNEIWLGLGSYGVGAAALNYFGKELAELTLEEAAYIAALPKGPANYHPVRRVKDAIERRNWVLDQMAENGFITRDQARAAKDKELKVNIRPFGTQIQGAEYFAEEVRRQLEQRYGKEGLYGRVERTGGSEKGVNGGLSVRTTLDPKMQRIARRALVDGLVAFDRQQGWRGPFNGKRIDITGDWGPALAAVDIPTDLAPWRLGVVLRVTRGLATIGLRPRRAPGRKLVPEREEVDISFEEMKWAKPPGSRSAPRAATDVLTPGDVVWVAPKDADQPDSAWSLMQIPEIGGGLIALDPHTGRVHAVVGGFSFSQSQFDRALQARRQPGSSYKPFVYAAALDNGYKSTSIVLDAPIALEQGPGKEIWTPKNYSDNSYGPSTLRVGIEKSRNQMTVRLAQDMGMPLIVEYSKRFGLYDDLLPVLAMSLGAGETTLARLAAGYATFVNGGKQVKYTLIDRIQDRWGKTIWRYDDRECPDCNAEKWEGQTEPTLPPDSRKQIIDPHTAYQMTSMMQGVVQRGTATVIRRILGNVPVAGKTGTTNDEKDAWFVGFTPDLVVGVFIGYDTPRPMGKGKTGGAVAAPIFAHFLKEALADKLAVPFRQPPGIRLMRVSLRTGLKASPGEKNTVLEAFKPTEEPDDEYSVIGFTNESGTFITPEQTDSRTLGSGKGLW